MWFSQTYSWRFGSGYYARVSIVMGGGESEWRYPLLYSGNRGWGDQLMSPYAASGCPERTVDPNSSPAPKVTAFVEDRFYTPSFKFSLLRAPDDAAYPRDKWWNGQNPVRGSIEDSESGERMVFSAEAARLRAVPPADGSDITLSAGEPGGAAAAVCLARVRAETDAEGNVAAWTVTPEIPFSENGDPKTEAGFKTGDRLQAAWTAGLKPARVARLRLRLLDSHLPWVKGHPGGAENRVVSPAWKNVNLPGDGIADVPVPGNTELDASIDIHTDEPAALSILCLATEEDA
jgi:hypothetical protein